MNIEILEKDFDWQEFMKLIMMLLLLYLDELYVCTFKKIFLLNILNLPF